MAKKIDLVTKPSQGTRNYKEILKEIKEYFEKRVNVVSAVHAKSIRKYLEENKLSKYYPQCTAFCTDRFYKKN